MTMTEAEYERERLQRNNNTIYDERNVQANSGRAPMTGAAVNRNAPYYEPLDIVAGALMTIMMLGPLFAYAVGWGG